VSHIDFVDAYIYDLSIVGGKRDEMIGGWRNFRNEVLNNLYASSNTGIIRVNKSRRMIWEGHEARTRKKMNG
jgi:hypothetical protein